VVGVGMLTGEGAHGDAGLRLVLLLRLVLVLLLLPRGKAGMGRVCACAWNWAAAAAVVDVADVELVGVEVGAGCGPYSTSCCCCWPFAVVLRLFEEDDDVGFVGFVLPEEARGRKEWVRKAAKKLVKKGRFVVGIFKSDEVVVL